MGAKKSWGVNEKVAEARAAKAAAKSSGKASKEKEAEEAYWSQHANPSTKKDAKRAEDVIRFLINILQAICC